MTKTFLSRLLFVLVLMSASLGLASPSAFPENAAALSFGYNGEPGLNIAGELLLPLNVVDSSLGLELYAPLSDFNNNWSVRLSGSALLFPAFGTTPPLALGVGADIGTGAQGFNIHAGAIVGTDLLFTLDLPMTASVYLAPGYATNTGFSLAWAAQLRYYFDNFALELASSDITAISLGARILF